MPTSEEDLLPSDELQIIAYISLNDASEIARLAAKLAPKGITSDPATLVDAAIALNLEATAGIMRHRALLIKEMRYKTLVSLADRLEIPEFPTSEEIKTHLRSPIMNPVVQGLLKFQKNALIEQDSRVGSPGSDSENDRVQKELEDFTFLFKRHLIMHRIDQKIRVAKIMIGRHSRHLNEIQNTLPSNPESIARTKDKLAGQQKKLSLLREAKEFFEKFDPKRGISREVAEAAGMFSDSLTEFEENISPEVFGLEAPPGFDDFWKKHRPGNIPLDQKSSLAVSTANRKSGKSGALTAGENLWKAHTEALISFCKGRKIPTSVEALDKLFSEFGENRASHKNTQIKMRGFFGTLATFSNQAVTAESVDSISVALKKERIKNASNETIQWCLGKMKAHNAKPGKSGRKSS